MNRLIFFDDAWVGQQHIRIRRADFELLMGSRALEVGAVVPVGEANGRTGVGSIDSIGEQDLLLSVDLQESGGSHIGIRLIVGMCRPQQVKRIVEFSAAVGVESLVWVPSLSGEKSYVSSRVFSSESLSLHRMIGVCQGGGTWIPEMYCAKNLCEVLTAESSRTESRKLLAETGALGELGALWRTMKGPQQVTIAIGAERGWASSELEQFYKSSFLGVQLGAAQLRVEHAVAVAIGQIFALRNV